MIELEKLYSFTFRGLGGFQLYLDIEWEPQVCYGACVFQNPDTKCYLYRSKYGNWVIGTKPWRSCSKKNVYLQERLLAKSKKEL